MYRALAALTLLITVLAGCGTAASPPPSTGSVGGSAGKPSTPDKILVGYAQPAFSFLPVWVAQDTGLGTANRLEIDSRLATSTTGMAALLSGELQLSVTGGPELLNATAAGADVVALANLTQYSVLRLMVTNDIKTKDDLVGKKIAITRAGSLQDAATRAMLQRMGLNPAKDVTYVSLDTGAAQDAAMVAGSVHAKLTSPPSHWQLTKMGNFHEMLSLAELKVPDGLVVVAQRSWYTANRDVAQRYIDTLVQAMARIRQDRTAAVAGFKKYLKVDDEQTLSQLYDLYVAEVSVPYPYVATEALQDALVGVQATDRLKGFDLAKVIDNSLVKRAEERGLGKA